MNKLGRQAHELVKKYAFWAKEILGAAISLSLNPPRLTEKHRIFLARPNAPGSIEHFAHFVPDYFLDLVVWASENPGKVAIVRDCGPCNPWFSVIQRFVNVEVRPKGEVKLLTFLHPNKTRVVAGDYGPENEWDQDRLQKFREVVVGTGPSNITEKGILVERRLNHSFYESWRSEIGGSGPASRSISNHLEVLEFLKSNVEIENVEFFDLEPWETVDKLRCAAFLIAQRGAGLMNLLFMPEGSTVVEILPRKMKNKRVKDMYHDAASKLGIKHQTVWQDSMHSTVNPAAVLYALIGAPKENQL